MGDSVPSKQAAAAKAYATEMAIRVISTAISYKRRGHPSFSPHVGDGFLGAGGYPDDLQTLMGWESGQMLRCYTKATASERAVQARKRMSPSDRLRLW